MRRRTHACESWCTETLDPLVCGNTCRLDGEAGMVSPSAVRFAACVRKSESERARKRDKVRARASEREGERARDCVRESEREKRKKKTGKKRPQTSKTHC
jgi:hypothetical protein